MATPAEGKRERAREGGFILLSALLQAGICRGRRLRGERRAGSGRPCGPPRLPVRPGSTLASAPHRLLLLLRGPGPSLLGPEALGVSRGERRAPRGICRGWALVLTPYSCGGSGQGQGQGVAWGSENTNSTAVSAVSLGPDVKQDPGSGIWQLSTFPRK